MRKSILFVAIFVLAGSAYAQQDAGSIDQSIPSESSSSTTTTTGSDSASNDIFDNAGSAEMRAWEKSNESSKSSGSDGNFSVGFGRDNDEAEDDRPRWSKPGPARPTPEQVNGSYRVSAKNGPFLCTVRLTASRFFDGYFATTGAGCPELWKVTRWDFEGSSLVLTNSSGDVYASFWPRDRNVWVGRSTSGQRLSLSR